MFVVRAWGHQRWHQWSQRDGKYIIYELKLIPIFLSSQIVLWYWKDTMYQERIKLWECIWIPQFGVDMRLKRDVRNAPDNIFRSHLFAKHRNHWNKVLVRRDDPRGLDFSERLCCEWNLLEKYEMGIQEKCCLVNCSNKLYLGIIRLEIAFTLAVMWPSVSLNTPDAT